MKEKEIKLQQKYIHLSASQSYNFFILQHFETKLLFSLKKITDILYFKVLKFSFWLFQLGLHSF